MFPRKRALGKLHTLLICQACCLHCKLGAQFHAKHEETDSVRTLCDVVLLAGEQGREGGEEALKGIREFFGSREVSVDSILLVLDSNVVVGCGWQAELEKALEAQEKRRGEFLSAFSRVFCLSLTDCRQEDDCRDGAANSGGSEEDGGPSEGLEHWSWPLGLPSLGPDCGRGSPGALAN